MQKMYFTKKLKLSIGSDFNSETYNTLKTDFYNIFMQNQQLFFLRNYEDALSIQNLKSKGYNEIITFESIMFDEELYDYDKPIQIEDKYKNKPNFPFLPFIAKSVIYDVINFDDNSFDLKDEDGNLITITEEQINQYKWVYHKL